jgi:hypothetical protein
MCSQQSQIKTSRSEGSSKHFCQYYLYLWATALSHYFGVLHGSGAQEGQISILRRVRSLSGKIDRRHSHHPRRAHHATSTNFPFLFRSKTRQIATTPGHLFHPQPCSKRKKRLLHIRSRRIYFSGR